MQAFGKSVLEALQIRHALLFPALLPLYYYKYPVKRCVVLDHVKFHLLGLSLVPLLIMRFYDALLLLVLPVVTCAAVTKGHEYIPPGPNDGMWDTWSF